MPEIPEATLDSPQISPRFNVATLADASRPQLLNFYARTSVHHPVGVHGHERRQQGGCESSERVRRLLRLHHVGERQHPRPARQHPLQRHRALVGPHQVNVRARHPEKLRHALVVSKPVVVRVRASLRV